MEVEKLMKTFVNVLRGNILERALSYDFM